MAKHLTAWRNSTETPWLKDAPVHTSQCALKDLDRNVPTFRLDSGMRFERSMRLFGQSYIQTLEPRLFYVYTPYRNQSFAPLFDTATADFGLAELFMPNSFVGNDRVSDASRLTAPLTTRFIDPSSGDERARFVLAEQYDFRTPQVTLNVGDPIGTVARTSVIGGASYKLGPGFSAEQAVEYSQANHYLSNAEIGFGWSPASRQVLNVAYRYTRANSTLDYQPVNQFIVSEQWPLLHNVVSVARINYDMSAHRLIAGLLGLQYDADCWFARMCRVIHRRPRKANRYPASAIIPNGRWHGRPCQAVGLVVIL